MALRPARSRNRLIPALLASGACGLMATPASALQLGELNVESALGQPLRASIAYALRPNEQLFDYCIFVRPAAGTAGLPGISQARISVANGRIAIQGTAPVNEPIVSLGVAVDCPYTANLTRAYTLMLDPLTIAEERSETRYADAPATTPVEPVAARPAPEARTVTRTRSAAASAPIGPSTAYRVQVGDSLSEIAQRIENRPVGLWSAVEQLFANNPDAFIDGDINRLKAGSTLTIPSFDGRTAPGVAAAEVGAPPATASTVAYEGPATNTASSADISSATYAGPDARSTPVEDTAIAPRDLTADLRPGDVAIDSAGSFVEPIVAASVADSTAGNDVTTADGGAEAPLEAAGETAATAGARSSTTRVDSSAGLLYWLGGAGVLLGGALFLFGRRFRRGTPPPQPIDTAADVADDEPTATNRALPAVDFDVSDLDRRRATSLLDADLNAGTGLSASEDVELNQDFAFSTSRDLGADLDMEFPPDTGRTAEDEDSTDVIPARRAEEHTILEREILPSDDDDDDDDAYDLSMIIDATKNRFADSDVTTKDLEAIAVEDDTGSDSDDEEEYTLSNEMDYQILEQDYEEELSATQVLNAEVLKAAEALQADLDAVDGAGEDTALTAEQTSILAAAADLDDTGVNEALALDDAEDADDRTTALPRRAVAAAATDEEEADGEIPADRTAEIPVARIETRNIGETGATTELTFEMPDAENDETAEISVESGHFRTGKTGSWE